MKQVIRLLLFVPVLYLACNQVTESKIYQWRGENRDGVFHESGLLKEWPEAGPELLWESEIIGDGYGSPTITDEQVFVNGVVDSISYLFAFDLQGNLLWKAANGDGFVGEGFSGSFPGARATPAIKDSLAYIISGMGRIACYHVTNGKEKWARDITEEFHGKPGYFGYSESPLLNDDKIYCFPGSKDTNAVALNRFSGETIWVSKALSDTLSYCSPMLIELPTRKILVNFTMHNLLGIDAETGELLWSHAQEVNQYNQPSNTPIFKEGYLYYLTSDGNGATCLKIADDGLSIKEVWRTPVADNTYKGQVIKDNVLYATNGKRKISAINTETGIIADSLKTNSGTLIAADDMLYLYADNGGISLINTSDSLHVVSKFKIKKGSREHFASLAIKNKVLYVRHGNALMAYDIAAKAE